MNELYVRWYMPLLNMDLEMLLFDHARYPGILFSDRRKLFPQYVSVMLS